MNSLTDSDRVVWKTLTLGSFDSVEALVSALGPICERVARLIRGQDFHLGWEVEEIDLVLLSVRQLGFEGTATYAHICARAYDLGLRLCPVETAPLLTVQLEKEQRIKGLLIASEAFPFLSSRSILCFSRSDGELDWTDGFLHSRFNLDCEFLFVLPRE